MSLQSYFSNKKYSIALFFSQLQEIIHQLSLVSQLQVDRQYSNAKNILTSSPIQIHEEFCTQMKKKQPYTIRKILNLLFQHAHNNLSAMYHLPSTQQVQAKVHPILNLHIKRGSKNLQVFSNQSERSIQRLQSKQKLKRNTNNVPLQSRQPMNKYTVTTQKKQQPEYLQSSLIKTKQKDEQIKINRQKYLLDTNQKVQVKCIQLLNKKRVLSSTKRSQNKQQQENDRKFNSMHKDNKINKFSLKNLRQEQRNTNRSYNQEQNYQSHNQSNSLKQAVQKNQEVCQKLDQKIHEQAIQILYKVKNKRSPSKKGYDGKASRAKNEKTTKHSILDISKTVLPISMVRNEGNKFVRSFD